MPKEDYPIGIADSGKLIHYWKRLGFLGKRGLTLCGKELYRSKRTILFNDYCPKCKRTFEKLKSGITEFI